MTRFSEFTLTGGFDKLEARLSLSRFAAIAGTAVSPTYGTDPVVPDPETDVPNDPPPPPEPSPGPFPGNPPPPVFPPPPIGGPVGPG